MKKIMLFIAVAVMFTISAMANNSSPPTSTNAETSSVNQLAIKEGAHRAVANLTERPSDLDLASDSLSLNFVRTIEKQNLNLTTSTGKKDAQSPVLINSVTVEGAIMLSKWPNSNSATVEEGKEIFGFRRGPNVVLQTYTSSFTNDQKKEVNLN
jgi:hypothetical protein